LKRAWTKKVKAILACAAGNNALKGHLKPVHLKVKRRVRTSAAMIGLAISMGASNILLTRHDHAPAAEPVGDEPTLSVVPVTTAAEGGSKNSVKPEPVKSLPAGAYSSTMVPPTPRIQQKAAILTPPLPVVEHKVQKRQSLRQSQKCQVGAVTLSYKVNHSQITPRVATVASQQLLVEESRRVTDEVNGSLKARQRFKLKRLKQKSKQLKDILASDKSNNPSAPESVSSSTAASQGATHGQQAASLLPKLATIDESAVLSAQKSEKMLSAAVMVPDLPKVAVNEPTVVVPSVSLDYRVKAGDTLSAIARKYSISLKELVDANQLTNPNRLQINQRIAIPAFLYSSAVGQTLVKKDSAHSLLPTPCTEVALSSRSNPAVDSHQESLAVPPKLLAATPSLGIGGSISDETAYESPPTDKSQITQLKAAKPEKLRLNPYVHNLQTDIQKLQQKYYAQQTVAAPQLANQAINPEFRPQQAAETLKPTIQKQRLTQVRLPVLPKTRAVTVPVGVDTSESLQPIREKQVFPDLPPLASVDTYLPKPFDNSARFKGYIWPTKGALTSGYGWRWGRMHKGIDIAAPIGTPVVAAAPGIVIKAGWNSGGYGRLVDIKHADGTFTRYAHNNRILVQAGQEVKQGQQISEMGSSGYSTGPHLHFELHPGGKGAVNPMAFLRRR
jgi:murein DD-endopeptidase MepM/ murein hydrolase activator NlpD